MTWGPFRRVPGFISPLGDARLAKAWPKPTGKCDIRESIPLVRVGQPFGDEFLKCYRPF